MKKIKIEVSNIQWDTDGEMVELSDNMSFTTSLSSLGIDEDYDLHEDYEDVIGEFVSDLITDESGFCHSGFNISITELV